MSIAQVVLTLDTLSNCCLEIQQWLSQTIKIHSLHVTANNRIQKKKGKKRWQTQRLIKKKKTGKLYNGHMDCFIRSQLRGCRNAKKICMRVQGWTALKIKQSKNVQQTKPGNVEWRRPLMKPAGPSPDRQRRGGGLIEGETHGGGWRERKSEGERE